MTPLPDGLALVINLESAVARRDFQHQQLQDLGLPFVIWPATAVSAVPRTDIARLGASWARPLRAAEVACTLSHRSAWAEVVASGRPRLILEDDVILSRGIVPLLAELLARGDLDCVTLETYRRAKCLSRRRESLRTAPYRVARLYRDRGGSAAYLLWPRAAARLLAQTVRRVPPADAAIDLASGFRRHQVEPAAAVQAMFLHWAQSGFEAIGASHISAVARPRYASRREWLRFKLRRLAISLRLFARQLAARDAQRRDVPWAEDLWRPQTAGAAATAKAPRGRDGAGRVRAG